MKKAPPAIHTGVLCLAAGLFLALVSSPYAWLPPALFVLLCLAAPFLPAMGFFHPVLSHGDRRGNRVALTFDDGPDPATTRRLLELLDETNTPACFFVTGRAAAAYPDLVQTIVAAGHEVGNHSQNHDPLLMLRSTSRLAREVDEANDILKTQGIRTHFFRPPVGITNPRLGPILAARGLLCVNFSRRGGDMGNRRIRDLARRVLAGVRSGDVILMHDRSPAAPFSTDDWLVEVRRLLDGLKDRGLRPAKLSELLEIGPK